MGKTSVVKRNAIVFFLANLVFLIITILLKKYTIEFKIIPSYIIFLTYFIILLLEMEISSFLLLITKQPLDSQNFLNNLICVINIEIFLMTNLYWCNYVFNNSIVGALNTKIGVLNLILFLAILFVGIRKNFLDLNNKKNVICISIGIFLFIIQLTILDLFSNLILFLITFVADRLSINTGHSQLKYICLVISLFILFLGAIKLQLVNLWIVFVTLLSISILVKLLGGSIDE